MWFFGFYLFQIHNWHVVSNTIKELVTVLTIWINECSIDYTRESKMKWDLPKTIFLTLFNEKVFEKVKWKTYRTSRKIQERKFLIKWLNQKLKHIKRSCIRTIEAYKQRNNFQLDNFHSYDEMFCHDVNAARWIMIFRGIVFQYNLIHQPSFNTFFLFDVHKWWNYTF